MSAPAASSSDGAHALPVDHSQQATTKQHVSFLVCGTRFDVDRKYKLIKPIGTGAYGVVWSVARAWHALLMFTSSAREQTASDSAQWRLRIGSHSGVVSLFCCLLMFHVASSAENLETKEKVAIKKITKGT
jgi:hypothetical protein